MFHERTGNNMITKGDIVQITNENDKWYPCLLVVDEVNPWGIILGYVIAPIKNTVGFAYYRIAADKVNKVGKAVILDELTGVTEANEVPNRNHWME
jgi:hypothetical protein